MEDMKQLLIRVQEAYPEALGFIMLNEGQGVEVYGQAGKVIQTLPMAKFQLMFSREESTQC